MTDLLPLGNIWPKSFWGTAFLTLLYFLFAVFAAAAQSLPPPITSSGLSTHISAPTTLPNGQFNYDITGGTRTGGGTNLFHSFGNFNVPNNNVAKFLNDTGLPTSNILGRVTGGSISNIFGTILTTDFEPDFPRRRARR